MAAKKKVSSPGQTPPPVTPPTKPKGDLSKHWETPAETIPVPGAGYEEKFTSDEIVEEEANKRRAYNKLHYGVNDPDYKPSWREELGALGKDGDRLAHEFFNELIKPTANLVAGAENWLRASVDWGVKNYDNWGLSPQWLKDAARYRRPEMKDAASRLYAWGNAAIEGDISQENLNRIREQKNEEIARDDLLREHLGSGWEFARDVMGEGGHLVGFIYGGPLKAANLIGEGVGFAGAKILGKRSHDLARALKIPEEVIQQAASKGHLSTLILQRAAESKKWASAMKKPIELLAKKDPKFADTAIGVGQHVLKTMSGFGIEGGIAGYLPQVDEKGDPISDEKGDPVMGDPLTIGTMTSLMTPFMLMAGKLGGISRQALLNKNWADLPARTAGGFIEGLGFSALDYENWFDGAKAFFDGDWDGFFKAVRNAAVTATAFGGLKALVPSATASNRRDNASKFSEEGVVDNRTPGIKELDSLTESGWKSKTIEDNLGFVKSVTFTAEGRGKFTLTADGDLTLGRSLASDLGVEQKTYRFDEVPKILKKIHDMTQISALDRSIMDIGRGWEDVGDGTWFHGEMGYWTHRNGKNLIKPIGSKKWEVTKETPDLLPIVSGEKIPGSTFIGEILESGGGGGLDVLMKWSIENIALEKESLEQVKLAKILDALARVEPAEHPIGIDLIRFLANPETAQMLVGRDSPEFRSAVISTLADIVTGSKSLQRGVQELMDPEIEKMALESEMKALTEEVEEYAPKEPPAEKPKTYVSTEDIEKVGPVKGQTITKEQVTGPLWHVTTAIKDVESSGLLKHIEPGEDPAGLGKGGALIHKGVSLTRSKEKAEELQSELLRQSEVAQLEKSVKADPSAKKDESIKALFSRYADEDSKRHGVPRESLDRPVQKALDRTETFPTEIVEALRLYRVSRATDSGIEDPVVFGGAEKWSQVRPENIQIVEVDPAGIPEGALIRELKPNEETFVHADIEISKPPAGAAPAEAKEPWEMTKEEFQVAKDQDYGLSRLSERAYRGAIVSDIEGPNTLPEAIRAYAEDFKYTNPELVEKFKDIGPEDEVTVYRAVSADDPTPISSGDWVALERAYAELHGSSGYGDVGSKILSIKVKAKDIAWAGTSADEYFYAPASARMPLAKGGHEVLVAQAISEGKPVPPEVLADYPDLQKEAAIQEEAVQTWNEAMPKESQVTPEVMKGWAEEAQTEQAHLASVRISGEFREAGPFGGMGEPPAEPPKNLEREEGESKRDYRTRILAIAREYDATRGKRKGSTESIVEAIKEAMPKEAAPEGLIPEQTVALPEPPTAKPSSSEPPTTAFGPPDPNLFQELQDVIESSWPETPTTPPPPKAPPGDKPPEGSPFLIEPGETNLLSLWMSAIPGTSQTGLHGKNWRSAVASLVRGKDTGHLLGDIWDRRPKSDKGIGGFLTKILGDFERVYALKTHDPMVQAARMISHWIGSEINLGKQRGKATKLMLYKKFPGIQGMEALEDLYFYVAGEGNPKYDADQSGFSKEYKSLISSADKYRHKKGRELPSILPMDPKRKEALARGEDLIDDVESRLRAYFSWQVNQEGTYKSVQPEEHDLEVNSRLESSANEIRTILDGIFNKKIEDGSLTLDAYIEDYAPRMYKPAVKIDPRTGRRVRRSLRQSFESMVGGAGKHKSELRRTLSSVREAVQRGLTPITVSETPFTDLPGKLSGAHDRQANIADVLQVYTEGHHRARAFGLTFKALTTQEIPSDIEAIRLLFGDKAAEEAQESLHITKGDKEMIEFEEGLAPSKEGTRKAKPSKPTKFVMPPSQKLIDEGWVEINHWVYELPGHLKKAGRNFYVAHPKVAQFLDAHLQKPESLGGILDVVRSVRGFAVASNLMGLFHFPVLLFESGYAMGTSGKSLNPKTMEWEPRRPFGSKAFGRLAGLSGFDLLLGTRMVLGKNAPGKLIQMNPALIEEAMAAGWAPRAGSRDWEADPVQRLLRWMGKGSVHATKKLNKYLLGSEIGINLLAPFEITKAGLDHLLWDVTHDRMILAFWHYQRQEITAKVDKEWKKRRDEAEAKGEDPNLVPYPMRRDEISRRAMESAQSMLGGQNWNYALRYHTKIPGLGNVNLLDLARKGWLAADWTTTQAKVGFRGLAGAMEGSFGAVTSAVSSMTPQGVKDKAAWKDARNWNPYKHLKSGRLDSEGGSESYYVTTSDFATAYFWRSWMLRGPIAMAMAYIIAQYALDDDEESEEWWGVGGKEMRADQLAFITEKFAKSLANNEQESVPTRQELKNEAIESGNWAFWNYPERMQDMTNLPVGRDPATGKQQWLSFGKQFAEFQHLLTDPMEQVLRKAGPSPRWVAMAYTGRDGIGRPLVPDAEKMDLWEKTAAWAKVYAETFLPIFGQSSTNTLMTLPLKEMSPYWTREYFETVLYEYARTGALEPQVLINMMMLSESNGINSHTQFQAAKSSTRSGLYETLMDQLLDGEDTKDSVRQLVRLGATAKDVRNAIGVSGGGLGFGLERTGRLQRVVSENRQRVIDWNAANKIRFEDHVGRWTVQAFGPRPFGTVAETMTEEEIEDHRENYRSGQALNLFSDRIKLWSNNFRLRSTGQLPEKK